MAKMLDLLDAYLFLAHVLCVNADDQDAGLAGCIPGGRGPPDVPH